MTTPSTRAGLIGIFLGLLALLISASSVAAPVVVTPGSVAGYSFTPKSWGSASSGSSSMVSTLNTCRVTPSAGDTTVNLSTKNWYGYTSPVTVYYKMVGGGAGAAIPSHVYTSIFPQFQAAGGSTAIFKNGALIAYARGMNSGEATRTVVTGSFQVSSTDSIRFQLGGGGGGSIMAMEFNSGISDYIWWSFTGGGGAGYYGGGAGQYAAMSNASFHGGGGTTPVATGGSNTGGTGGGGGSPNVGGTDLNHGYNGWGATATAYGGNGPPFSLWNGFGWDTYGGNGGGGGYGQTGRSAHFTNVTAGTCTWDPGAPSSPPVDTSFTLSPYAGIRGYTYTNCIGGGGFGMVVLQYQAPTCDLIPNYNE